MNCRTSSYAPRFLAVAAIAVLVVALSGVPAHAQIVCTTMTAAGCPTLSLVGASMSTGQSLNAPAPIVTGDVLQLTHNLQSASQDGAAWFNTQQQIASGFGVEFQFRISNGGTGDGFAFVIQNSSLAAIGGWGGGMGYGTHETDTASGVGSCPGDGTDSTTAAQTSTTPCAASATGLDVGISNSVAIEFDTYANLYDLDANHVAIQSCGTLPNSPDHDSSCLIVRSGEGFLGSLATPINLADGATHYVQIVYLPYSATCPTASPCPNLSVYIDPADPLNLGAPVVQAHVDLNNPCFSPTARSGCATGAILSGNTAAWVGFTGATGGAEEEADILSFTFTPSVTHTLQGSGVTNSFVFPFATYNVTYPADVPITGTTMTITPTLLPGTLSTDDCNARIAVFGSGNNPTCTTFGAPAGGDAAIFDVACAQGTNQTQGDTNPPGAACPVTSGFNPLIPAGNGNFHSSEDVSNILVFPVTGGFPAGFAPQFLTASEGTNGWVPIGVGFDTDCCTKGGGTSNYQSQMVAADFPGSNSPFAVKYTFNGFTSPVNPPVINSAQAGQTIPFKWQLLYPTNSALGFNGGPVTNLSLVTNGAPTTFPFLTLGVTGDCLVSQANLAFDESVPVDTESQNGLVNQGNGFYQYNWQTPKVFNNMALAGQCLVVTADVGDGVSHEANIQFHK